MADEMKDFFAPGGSTRVKIKGPKTCGIRLIRDQDDCTMDRRREYQHSNLPSGVDYAEEYKQRELQSFIHSVVDSSNERDKYDVGLNSFENLSSIGEAVTTIGELTDEALVQVYNNYSFKRELNPNLSINDYKEKILLCIRSQMITIIEGPTGCGKTTQVPQWILDDAYETRKHCNIIVTQPRRIAAMSIAKRVAQERGWDLGGVVGYQVGLENVSSNDTRLHFVTTGVLLQKLVAAQTLEGFTHVILDEIHERDQEMDFLLLVVRKLLFTNSRNVKIILMSATFNIEDFAKYFAQPTQKGYDLAGVLKVEKKNPYIVKTFYLNQLDKFIDRPEIIASEPGITPKGYNMVIRLLHVFEKIDSMEDEYENEGEPIPSVLVFLPGINEIEDLYNKLSDKKYRADLAGKECADYKWWVVPLHSTITADEQARVFQKAPINHRKIILSTNIAESSITVPDIKYVIDFCLMKQLVADPQTNFTCLQMKWASKTNCKQRAGRAGRVRDGRVYRLVPEHFYEDLDEENEPEMQRCPLERLVLLSKMLNMGSPAEILALAMNPPDLGNISRTVLTLKEMGGLFKSLNGLVALDDGEISYLGRIMAKLPVDVRVTKLIMLGYIFGCLEDTVIMGAAMSVKNVFSNPFQERLNAYNSKLTWADGSTSDCIAFLNVYKVWRHFRQQQYFKQSSGGERQWARSFYLQLRALKELDDMVRELFRRLSREGIEQKEGNQAGWTSNEKPLILKFLIAGAFYPHYFIQSVPDESRERDALKVLNGCDPRNTVYLKDFPPSQPGPLYAASIKSAIKQYIGDDVRLIFDKNSYKVFLQFTNTEEQEGKSSSNNGNPNIPGRVVLPVYKAVKMRQLNLPIFIRVLPTERANAMMAALEAIQPEINIGQMVPRLPDIDENYFYITISQFIDPGHFWAQYDDESTASDLRSIQVDLNRKPLLAYTDNVSPGDMLAAPYQDGKGTSWYRARVQKVLPNNEMVWIFYIDYGGYGRVNVSNLRCLPTGICRELPPLAMECVLAEVGPSLKRDLHGKWTQAALNFFKEVTQGRRLIAQVYSVAHGVISVTLRVNDDTNINELMIKKGYAQYTEESYDSKMNHDLRETSHELNQAQKRAYNKQQTDLAFTELREITAPHPRDCVVDLRLKGPFSPLETTIHTVIYGSREKSVQIEWNSVNAVLLDTEPQNPYERLLVSASVGQNQSGEKLTLRHTTLLPHIPGLPALIAMTFCPTMELRADASHCHYASVLCGLGSDDFGRPLFPEHDMLLNIDADINNFDLLQVNHLRHLMDFTLYCGEGEEAPQTQPENKTTIPCLIRDILHNVLWRDRKHHEFASIPRAWEWKSVDPEAIQDLCDNQPSFGERSIYPLHNALNLDTVDTDELLRQFRENQKLHKEVSRNLPSTSRVELSCSLCGTGPMHLQALRIHLYSRMHRDKEEDFKMFQFSDEAN